jgi:hypothetical protein
MLCPNPDATAAPTKVQLTLGSTDVLAANKSITQNVTVVSGGDAEKAELLVALFKRLFMDVTAGALSMGLALYSEKQAAQPLTVRAAFFTTQSRQQSSRTTASRSFS